MQFGVIGALEVTAGQRSIPVRPGKQQQVLAALLLTPNRTVSYDRICEAIWEHDVPPSASSLLRLYVSQLRRVLPEPCIETRPGGYAVVVAEGALDRDRFEQQLGAAREALASGAPSEAHELLTDALALWRGPGFAGMRTDTFEEEARRLAELRAACLEERFEAELSLGRHEHAVPELAAHVAAEPLRERPRGQLMLALYRSGRHADALAAYRAGRRVLDERLGLEPSPALRDLERRILAHDPTLALAPEEPAEVARALPAPPTRTIGREAEIAGVCGLLRDGARLVTLTGMGGIGKSRLALEVARTLAADGDAAALVPLGDEPDPRRVLAVIGIAIGLREGATDELDAVCDRLSRAPVLLVLDDLEHLTAAAPVLAALLARVPGLRLLATSRVALRIRGERVHAVPPLTVAASAELFAELGDAEGLLGRRAGEREQIERACELLDGLPLAVELAAPWLRVLSPAALVERLSDRLALLAGGRRDLPERQRTLRAAIDWSHQLLGGEAQAMLAALGVFEGGFELAAAEQVAGGAAPLVALRELIDASLVARDGDRYRLLDTIRAYAVDRLAGDDGPPRRHAAYFSALADEAEPALAGPDQARWLVRLDREHGNLRAAIAWLERSGDTVGALHLAAALARYWYLRGHLDLASEQLARALAAAGPGGDPADRAKALRTSSAIGVLRGRYAEARRHAEGGLAVYRELGDRVGIARSLSNLGAILHAQGELAQAAAVFDEAIALCGPGDERVRALALNNRGDAALSGGDWDAAGQAFAESLALLEALGDRANVARSIYNLAAVELGRERYDAASGLLARSLRHACELDDREDMAWSLLGLAAVDAHHGRADSGRQLLATAESLLQEMGASLKPYEARLHARTRRALGTAADGVPGDPLSAAAVAELAASLRA